MQMVPKFPQISKRIADIWAENFEELSIACKIMHDA